METSKEIPVDKDECSGCHRRAAADQDFAAPNANMRSTAPKTVKLVTGRRIKRIVNVQLK
jgi:hypothetical protein